MTAAVDRRRFLQTSGAAALGAAASTVLSPAELLAAPGGDERPNVLILMTDEQHFRSLSSTGNPYIETPHMDRIGREGAVFNNATCVTPYCSPSRASMITGLYPHSHDILTNVSPGRNTQGALEPDAFPNVDNLLAADGYSTAHRGKWHLGDKGDFDCYESFGYASRTARGYRDMLNRELPPAQFAGHPSPGKYQGRPVEMLPVVERGFHEFYAQPNNNVAYISIIGESLIPPALLPETQITDQVLGLIDDRADEPFMITASWSPPHDLWVIPEPYYSMVDRNEIELPGTTELSPLDERGPSKRLGDILGPEGIREYAAIYHGMVKYIDDQIGRVLAKLEERGLMDNTLILFTSDHGDMVGAHGCVGKSISSFYDDLTRIPLSMRLPGKIPANTVVDQPVSQIDFMPTLLDYCGQPVPEDIHGRSVRPLIEGRDVSWRDHAFCQRANNSRMLQADGHKYSCFFRGRPGGKPTVSAALYDMENDPREDVNLALNPAHAAKTREMHTRLLEVMATDGDPAHDRFDVNPL